jgi:hypothetical protein
MKSWLFDYPCHLNYFGPAGWLYEVACMTLPAALVCLIGWLVL